MSLIWNTENMSGRSVDIKPATAPATSCVCNGLRLAIDLRTLHVLSVLCGSYISAEACTAADIRSWAFEATVIHIDDPKMLFSDVRLGDTVRGTFGYDLDYRPPLPGEEFWDYTFPGWFQGLRILIENPRMGVELRYLPHTDYYIAVATDDYPFFGGSLVQFWQQVTPPLPGLATTIFIDFAGKESVDEPRLPTAYNLDDWPTAVVTLGADSGVNGLTAQIHTLTPIAPGDFDLDDTVDADDYAVWRSTYGPTGFSEADWNRNGTVDAADYVIWRNNAGATSGANQAAVAPEPTTAALGLLFLARAGLAHRRTPNRARSMWPRIHPRKSCWFAPVVDSKHLP
jgi:hypothetical protein